MSFRRVLSLFFVAAVGLMNAAEEAAKAEGGDSNLIWKIANFLIFAGGIGYLIFKTAPAFFNARSADIQQAIGEATGLKMNADLRYSEIDRKMANLSGEVGKLRQQAEVEMEREHQRMIAQTNDEIAYVQRNTAAEVEALRAEGAGKLRAHATQEALKLAEARLRQRFANGDQQDLVGDFLQLVEKGKN